MKEKEKEQGETSASLPTPACRQRKPLRLAGMIAGWTYGKHQVSTAIPGLELHRWDPTEPHSYMFSPHLCLIAQGTKQILLGDEAYLYDAQSFVVSSVELPLVSKIMEASRKNLTWD